MIKNYSVLAAKIIFTAFILIGFQPASAQNCFEIRSILVDACGAPEGENEMVRFDIGNAPLQVADLNVIWANVANSYNGICQDATTAAKVDTLNQGISGCGYLVEPTAGVLPAFSKVLLITSTNFSTVFNSFANLNDTLVIIFQCAGNTNGHFANYNSTPGNRTLVMEFSNPAGCIDSVTYDRSLLVNQNGTIGGGAASNDGSFVEFSDNGSPTYLNNGCQALTTSLTIDAGADIIACTSATINFNATATGSYVSSLWTGGNGSFSNDTSLSTSYVISLSDTGNVDFIFTVTGFCGATTSDTVHAYFPISITSPVLTAIDTVLTCSLVSPNYMYSWTLNGTALAGNSYTQTTSGAGCYQVMVTDTFGCSVLSDSICVTFASVASINENVTTSLLPNPTASIQHLVVNSLTNINVIDLQLMSVTGATVFSKTQPLNSKLFETDLDFSGMPKGIYFLKVTTDKKHTVIKVVKE
jgi:hypothetical protein